MLIFALVLFMLAGFGALALDTAYLYARQNKLQTTADAGALAAASQLPDVAETTAVAFEFVAKSMPVASYGDVLVNADVVVGTWDAAARTFEPGGESPDAVRVATRSADANGNPAAAFFAQVFGHRSVDVSASSVAGIGKPFCLLALAPDGEGIRVDSNSNITLNGCSIQVNSDDSLALSTYSNATITADSMCVNGYYSGAPSSYSPLPDTGCPVKPDPLADLLPPSSAGCDFNDTVLDGNDSHTLSPGIYCGGLRGRSNVTITLLPGIYIIKDGPLDLDSNVSMSGTDVGFYLTGAEATVDFDSNTQVNLAAPTSGLMEGIIFFEDRESPLGRIHQFDSNTNQQYEGTLYFPRGTIDLDSNSSGVGTVDFTAIIADRFLLDSNSTLYLNGNFDASNVPARCELTGRCVTLLQ